MAIAVGVKVKLYNDKAFDMLEILSNILSGQVWSAPLHDHVPSRANISLVGYILGDHMLFFRPFQRHLYLGKPTSMKIINFTYHRVVHI